MAEMEMREIAHGEFIWMWSATNDFRPCAATDDSAAEMARTLHGWSRTPPPLWRDGAGLTGTFR